MSVELKNDASDAAAGANDVAAGLAVATGIAAVGGFATGGIGYGIAGVLTIASGIAWAIANEYSELAADPPRFDHNIVTKFKSTYLQVPLANTSNEAVWNKFINIQTEIGGAIAALITSFERLDGARIDLKKPDANVNILAYRITKQRKAIKHNAGVACKAIEVLLSNRNQINKVWRLNSLLFYKDKFISLTEEDRKTAIEKLLLEIKPSLEQIFNNPKKVKESLIFIHQSALSDKDLDEVLLNDKWFTTMQNLKKQLSVFSGERSLKPLLPEPEYRIKVDYER